MYISNSGQLFVTYQIAVVNSTGDRLRYVGWLINPTLLVNTLNASATTWSAFLSGRLKIVSTRSKCKEHQVKHSCTMYASAIDPSGRALFLTKRFKVPRYLEHKKGMMELDHLSDLLQNQYIQETLHAPLDRIHPAVRNRST